MRTLSVAGAPGWKTYAALWIAMIGLRQDFWNWRDPSLVFGILPVGLAYQAGYSLIAAGVLAVLVRYAWPGELEALDEPVENAEREDARR